jgi:hypothetical protein
LANEPSAPKRRRARFCRFSRTISTPVRSAMSYRSFRTRSARSGRSRPDSRRDALIQKFGARTPAQLHHRASHGMTPSWYFSSSTWSSTTRHSRSFSSVRMRWPG